MTTVATHAASVDPRMRFLGQCYSGATVQMIAQIFKIHGLQRAILGMHLVLAMVLGFGIDAVFFHVGFDVQT